MDAAAAMMIGATIVPLTEMIKYARRVPEAWGVPIVLILSALGVLLWGVSQPEWIFVRTNVWGLFAGWVNVAVTAAGVYGFIREGRAQVMNATRTGGDGQ